jgi:hypothetical protein
LLKVLELDFNEGIIIKMNLDEKVALRDKLSTAIANREELRQEKKSALALNSLAHNLSESNVRLGKKSGNKIQ